mmetsp:Transcript_18897/g.44163  ORF Transcript_18897/g.44163 Transcript_18897/m.44163 type:complete len:254 (-) Transcript_18897:42-803(-)
MVIQCQDSSERSLGSTFSAGRLSYKRIRPVTPAAPQQAPPKKKVCFCEDENEYIVDHRDPEPQEHDCCDNTWYTAQEIHEFRVHSQRLIRAARKEREEQGDDATCTQETFYGTLLQLYRIARKEEHRMVDAMKLLKHTQLVLEEDLKQLYVPKKTQEHGTTDLDEEDKFLDMIGLEYQVILTMKKDSKYLRQEVQKVVKDIQRECQEGQWEAGSDALLDEYRDSLVNFTQAPQLFAQLLAVAQYESFKGQLSM